jgi:hypothetical protein
MNTRFYLDAMKPVGKMDKDLVQMHDRGSLFEENPWSGPKI